LIPSTDTVNLDCTQQLLYKNYHIS